MTISCIRKARWVVAWDAHLQQHYFRNDIDVVFDGNRIVHVDPAYAGKVDVRSTARASASCRAWSMSTPTCNRRASAAA
jgi:hypothetical protein